jgi:pimeloyl-ACP methyl ester carboxylesterase
MHLDEWKAAGQEFTYRGQQIFYHDEGAGEVLVCLHGFPTASWDWHRLWPHLTKRFRVIAADMLGFGFSDKPRDYPYSIQDQATLHERLLEALEIRRTHLLAHDYGDTVAQELLARQEERQEESAPDLEIPSACFLNGGLFPEIHRPLLIQKLLLSPLGPLVASFVSERRFRWSFSSIFGRHTRPSSQELQEFWELITCNEGVKAAPRVIQYMQERQANRARWVGILQTTKVPLQLIIGAEDPVSGAQVAARYAELVPNPDMVVLDDVGHYPQLEAPDRVLQAYLAFCSQT